ncbi:hypothetical protein KC19_3G186500 [Ceratodon purpureus]|uniref:Secreted protein n=1 Tax=Ceratodon purpureus TaxID=3225 RepID=A0A8T0IMF0_CERPU|nr:hypothetical protein KC19_3G186500 [Ceratodon purpureus]
MHQITLAVLKLVLCLEIWYQKQSRAANCFMIQTPVIQSIFVSRTSLLGWFNPVVIFKALSFTPFDNVLQKPAADQLPWSLIFCTTCFKSAVIKLWYFQKCPCM